MKRRFEAQESPHVPQKKVPSIRAESPPVETSADSSNDLGERLTNLPFELKQMIICSLSPEDRCQLRLVNKAMLGAVDASMSDVLEIEINFNLRDTFVNMRTTNPYNDVQESCWYTSASSSVPFLLKWAGARLKKLKLTMKADISEDEDFDLRPLYQIYESLNSENACPKLKNLSLDMNRTIWDNNEIIPSELLKYVTRRQWQAKATDHPAPFLHSLSLHSTSYLSFSETHVWDALHSEEEWRKFLQDLLDQCHGLQELDVDSLLVQKDLPVVALRYPTTLTELMGWQLGRIPRDLSAIIGNCANLQNFYLNVGFPHDDENLRYLTSLSELRELTLMGHLTEEEIMRKISQCLAVFEDHPFGVSIARPWPQLKSVELSCYEDEGYNVEIFRLHLSGVNYCFTSLDLTGFKCQSSSGYIQSMEHLFKALNSEDACPNLMELNINACELSCRVRDSLAATKDREPQALQCWLNAFGGGPLVIPQPHVYGMLNDLLAYVTKRQSAVRLGKPFLRSLTVARRYCYCGGREGSSGSLSELRDQLEQIRTTVQQILDQCHGLKNLYMESLMHAEINPDEKEGRELMELVPLRFPTTLKKLNGVWLD